MDAKTAWVIYFSGIVSLQYHPRNPPKERMSLEACAEVADKMLLLTINRLTTEEHPTCPS